MSRPLRNVPAPRPLRQISAEEAATGETPIDRSQGPLVAAIIGSPSSDLTTTTLDQTNSHTAAAGTGSGARRELNSSPGASPRHSSPRGSGGSSNGGDTNKHEYHSEGDFSNAALIEKLFANGCTYKTVPELLLTHKHLFVSARKMDTRGIAALKNWAVQRAVAIAKSSLKRAEDVTRWGDTIPAGKLHSSTASTVQLRDLAHSSGNQSLSGAPSASRDPFLTFLSRVITEVLLDKQVRLGPVPSIDECKFRAEMIEDILLKSSVGNDETAVTPKLLLSILLLPIRDRNPAKNDGPSPDMGEALCILRLWCIGKAVALAVEMAKEQRMSLLSKMDGFANIARESIDAVQIAIRRLLPLAFDASGSLQVSNLGVNSPRVRAESPTSSTKQNSPRRVTNSRRNSQAQVSANPLPPEALSPLPPAALPSPAAPPPLSSPLPPSVLPISPPISSPSPSAALSPSSGVSTSPPIRPASPSSNVSLSRLLSRAGKTIPWFLAGLPSNEFHARYSLKTLLVRDVARYPCFDTDPSQDADAFEQGCRELLRKLELFDFLDMGTHEQLEQRLIDSGPEGARRLTEFKAAHNQIYKEKLEEYTAPFIRARESLFQTADRIRFQNVAQSIDSRGKTAHLIEPVLHNRLFPQLTHLSNKERLEFMSGIFSPRPSAADFEMEKLRRSVLWGAVYGAAQYVAAYESSTGSKNRLGLDDVSLLAPDCIRLSIHRKPESFHQFTVAVGMSLHRTPWQGTMSLRHSESERVGRGGAMGSSSSNSGYESSGSRSSTPTRSQTPTRGGKEDDVVSPKGPVVCGESRLSLELKHEGYVPLLIDSRSLKSASTPKGGVSNTSSASFSVAASGSSGAWGQMFGTLQPFVWLSPNLVRTYEDEVKASIPERKIGITLLERILNDPSNRL